MAKLVAGNVLDHFAKNSLGDVATKKNLFFLIFLLAQHSNNGGTIFGVAKPARLASS